MKKSKKQLLSNLKYLAYFLTGSVILSLLVYIIWKYPFLSMLRIILGLFLVLFLPGYVVVYCFLNKSDWIEKLTLSLGLSIVLVILGVLFSNMLLGIPITPLYTALVILGVIAITILVKIIKG